MAARILVFQHTRSFQRLDCLCRPFLTAPQGLLRIDSFWTIILLPRWFYNFWSSVDLPKIRGQDNSQVFPYCEKTQSFLVAWQTSFRTSSLAEDRRSRETTGQIYLHWARQICHGDFAERRCRYAVDSVRHCGTNNRLFLKDECPES